MARISERISSAVSMVECPGCGKRVVPAPGSAGDSQPAQPPPSAAEGQRWSFIWRPPSGAVCPECFFPLDRYVRRIKWIRTFSAGLTLCVVALMLFILSLLNPPGTGVANAAKLVGIVGGAVLVVGLVGVVLGGRRVVEETDRP